MENINFNFEKFVEDIEQKDTVARKRKMALQQQQDAWAARRRLNALYRENPHNRIHVKR